MRNQRLNWPDNLRSLAIIGVVFVHVSDEARPHFIIDDLLFAGWARVAVPIFIMLSGALILPGKFDLFPFLKKRLLRVVVPFLFWCLVYCLVRYPFYHNGDTLLLVPDFIAWSAKAFYSQAISPHFWYIYMLIGLYLFAPVIIKWVQHSQKREIEYFLIVWLVTIIAATPFNLIYFSEYLGYMVLGYYLLKWPPAISKGLLWPVFLLGWLITCLGTYFYSQKAGAFQELFYNYLSINVILMTIPVFVILMKTKFTAPALLIRIRNFTSKYSYGIYLVHILVLNGLKKIDIKWNMFNPALGIPVTVAVCFCISAIIIYVVNRLPVVGKYVSG